MTADYHLRELRRALHDPRGPKAAVMVGAGFSLNAEAVGDPGSQFPNWAQLTAAIVHRLYQAPDDYRRKLVEAGTVSSALRFAQEFEIAFGRPALIDVVRDSIRDDDFIPGDAHRSLVTLPWADVFTTNYDRLLERAAERTWNRKYDTVLNCDDLPLARRPRIVKLHGSLPDLRGLVLTEDDFRAYPRRYAPFVNAVQASLSENIFCLIGFSANDPNFLAWTGWVRDELANSAPYMFLFTGTDLLPFQRQLLESRRIIPIQIRGLAKTQDYAAAYKWLFDQLSRRLDNPQAFWNRIPGYATVPVEPAVIEPFHATLDVSPEKRSDEWLSTALLWRRNRREFKGWHILNRAAIQDLWARTEFWIRDASATSIGRHSPPIRLFILHELAWRCAHCLSPLLDNLVFDVIDPTLEAFRKWKTDCTAESVAIGGEELARDELQASELTLTLEMLRHAREIGDATRFEQILSRVNELLDERRLTAQSNERHFVVHQQVLFCLSRLNQTQARELLQSWEVANANMIWTVRRAGLLSECGLVELAQRMLAQLLSSIRRIPATAEAHIPQLSAEGLLLTLFWYVTKAHDHGFVHNTKHLIAKEVSADTKVLDEPTLRERLDDLAKLGCDPHKVLDWLTLENKEAADVSMKSEEEGFDLGQVKRTMRMGAGVERSRLAYQGLRFIEEAGLPLSIHGIISLSVASPLFHGATHAVNRFAFHEAIGPLLRAQDNNLIESCLTRERLYRLPERHFSSLKQCTNTAFQKALATLPIAPERRESEDQWMEKQLHVAILVQSRLIIRQDQDEVVTLLRNTIPLIGDRRTASRWALRQDIAKLLSPSLLMEPKRAAANNVV